MERSNDTKKKEKPVIIVCEFVFFLRESRVRASREYEVNWGQPIKIQIYLL
jgi:hypothetical protein